MKLSKKDIKSLQYLVIVQKNRLEGNLSANRETMDAGEIKTAEAKIRWSWNMFKRLEKENK